MITLIYFIGKSGTGKDTIFNKIMSIDQFKDIIRLIPSTTRPIRKGEVNGKDYFFNTYTEYKELSRNGNIIEERHYNTVNGEWIYFTSNTQIEDGKIYSTIGTLESYRSITEYYKDKDIKLFMIPVYIEVNDYIRFKRLLEREHNQNTPHYDEMCRRYLADCEDFTIDKVKAEKIFSRFNNDSDVESTVQDIADYITMMIRL